jgi:ABC-type transport system involved in multi-copper enzyme maturation permease subunit
MFRLIVEKELRELIGTPRFAATFGVCSLLILLAFFTGAQNYRMMQARYDSARQENLRQMASLTTDEWIQVSPSVFVPPQPLAALVSGVSNDIGRSVQVQGRGELALENSLYSDDTTSAVFRLLDLEFVFTLVFSLFAILFCYNAVNGEKEQGTLRLIFSNPIARDLYILGKLAGSFLALGVPLLIPILLGSLLFAAMGVPMTGDEWLRLALIVGAGLLYFGVFLMASVLVSALSARSSSSFIVLLVFWILAVLVVPRAAVLFAGRTVEVPSIDDIAYQKRQKMMQMASEDMKALAASIGGESDGASFRLEIEETSDDPEAAQQQMQERMENFMKKQRELADKRDEEMAVLSEKLNTERYNRQQVQQRWAFGLAQVSPAASFTLAITELAGTSLRTEDHFMAAVRDYQTAFKTFQEEKAGLSGGAGFMIVMRTETEGGEEAEPEPIDVNEVPAFSYTPPTLQDTLPHAIRRLGMLAVFNLVFFAAAFTAFVRYDVR